MSRKIQHRGIVCAKPIGPEECTKVLWGVDGKVFDGIVLDADDITDNPSGEELIKRTLKRNGIDCGKVETFTILQGNVAMSVYPNYESCRAPLSSQLRMEILIKEKRSNPMKE